MTDKKVRRQIRLTEKDWGRIDFIADVTGGMSGSDAVRFLIREWKASHPQSPQHRTDNVGMGKQSERLTLRVTENDKKTLDLIAKSLGGVSGSTVMRHLIRQWAAQQKESRPIKSS